jgi:hypothetical protein
MMRDSDFPIRMAGARLNFDSTRLAGITPSEVTRRLRYQAANPAT